MERVLEKKDLQKFLDSLKKTYKVIGPTKKGGATATYAHATFGFIDKIEDLEIDYKSTMLSPKIIFFPDNQPLFGYKKKEDGVNLKDLREVWNEQRVLLGLHPCDIAALSCLDKVFGEKGFEDESYNNKRSKSIIIGVTCAEPQKSCFCNVLGTGPDAETGYDLLMTDLGDGYFFRAETAIGREIISADYFKDATDQDRVRREREIERVSKELPDDLEGSGISEVMAEKYNDELWDEFSDECLTCGACNMVCPTCHCFTIKDKTTSDRSEGTRLLVWDSCHFERFAKMAGDLTVREEKSSRFKHRLYDKFYYDKERSGTVFCVGCGRCIEFCPSHIDIRAALRKLQEV